MNIIYKMCSRCQETKPIEEFGFDKNKKDGRNYLCKKCGSERTKEWQKANPEKVNKKNRLWAKANPEKIREKDRRWNKANRKKRIEYVRRWEKAHPEKAKELNQRTSRERTRRYYNKNRQKCCEQARQYARENPEKIRESWNRYYQTNHKRVRELYRKAYIKKRNQPQFRLNNNIRTGISRSVNGNKQGRHWETLVGYTLTQLKKHLENLFKEGMTWENYGKWHIDHRIPISAFNFKKPEHIDFKRCWALKNLRPMWAKENIIKSNKLPKPFQPSLLLQVIK